MEFEDLLQEIARLNRLRYQAQIPTEAPNTPPILLGWEPSSGLAILQDAQGNIFYSEAATNGAVGIGEAVRSRGGGGIRKYDAMPGKIPPLPQIQSPTLIQVPFALLYYQVAAMNTNTAPAPVEQYYFAYGCCRRQVLSLPLQSTTYPTLAACEAANSCLSAGAVEPGYIDVSPPTYTSFSKQLNYISFYPTVNGGAIGAITTTSFLCYASVATTVTMDVSMSGDVSGIQPQSGLSIDNSVSHTMVFTATVSVSNTQNPADFSTPTIVQQNSSNTVNVTLSLAAGYNTVGIEIQGLSYGFSWEYSDEISYPDAFTVNGSVAWNPPPEPINVNNYFLKSNNQIYTLASICAGETLEIYLQTTPTQAVADFFYWQKNTTQFQFLERYTIANAKSTSTTYTNPQTIPDITNGWLNIPNWNLTAHQDSNLITEMGNLGACLTSPLNLVGTNFYQNTLYQCNLTQTINGVSLPTAINSGSCNITYTATPFTTSDNPPYCNLGTAANKTVTIPQITGTLVGISLA